MNLRETIEGEMKWTEGAFKKRKPSYDDYHQVMKMEPDDRDNALFDAGLISAYQNVLRWMDEN